MPRTRSQHPLVKLCDESSLPIYALDDQRRIVSCNPACAAWLGLTLEQLIGQRCDYAATETAPVERAAATALCPPPQAFVGETAQGRIVWRGPSGEIEQRAATFVPLGGDDPAAVLAVLGEAEPVALDAAASPEGAQAEELHRRLQQLMHRMRSRFRLDQIVGESPVIRRVREQVAAAVATRARVLIVGPPGSGREHIARTIVYADQPERERLLRPLDCARLDAESLQSSLAALPRRGHALVNPAEVIVLLLHVDQLTPPVQTDLAATLRSPTFGCRLLATARQSLVELAAGGTFNRELAFALSTLLIELPALRDRREDIPLLVQRLVEEQNATGGRQLAGFAPAALDRLASLPWNGNLEELSTVVRESLQNASTVWIGEADLPARVREVVAAGRYPRRDPEPIQLDAFLLEVERELVDRALRCVQGNKAGAARLLGVSRARLLRRLQQWGLLPREEAAIDFQLIEEDDALPDKPVSNRQPDEIPPRVDR